MSNDFKIWWHNEGSGMPPFKDEETCDHVERVSAIAWSNGAFKATLSLDAENARLKAEVERLTNENGNNFVLKEEWYLKCLSARADVERLRASSFVTAVPVEQYERLIKAGDAMAKTANKEITRSEFGHLAMAWSAAKDGLGCPVNPDRVAQYLPKPPTAAKEGKLSV